MSEGCRKIKIGFIGLGRMGKSIALNLLRAGHSLKIYNRSKEPALELQKEGAILTNSPVLAATDVEVMITMLSDDAAVESIVLGGECGAGILEGLKTDAIHLGISTVSPALAARLEKMHSAKNQIYVSGPVFGRPEAALLKKLWFILAGDEKAIVKCLPIFDATSQGHFVVGPRPSMANIFKLSGNFLIASVISSLGEIFSFLDKIGGNKKQFLEIINNALFRSPVYEKYGHLISDAQFEQTGFSLQLALKDFQLILNTAEQNEIKMPLAQIICDQMLAGVSKGNGEKDWSVLGSSRISSAQHLLP